MRHYVAGQLAYAREITWFLAPYINSYKRFQVGTFAPTKTIWSLDNRTAGFRLCGAESKAIRIECRVGGSDLNPYLAFAALLAAGIDGIENKLELEAPFVGDAYGGKGVREIPRTLRAATAELVDGTPRALDRTEVAEDAAALQAALAHAFPGARISLRETGRVIRAQVAGVTPPPHADPADYWPGDPARAWRFAELSFVPPADQPPAVADTALGQRPVERNPERPH